MKKSAFIYMFLLIFSSLLVVGCDDDDDSSGITGLAITPSSVPTLPVGEAQQFTATSTYSDGSTLDNTSIVMWSSSDSSVVSIDATGLAVTKADGTANISALYGVTSNIVTMEVSADAPPPATDPGDYNPDNVCDAEFCATDDVLSQTCSTFLAACIANEPANEDECVGGALVICQNPDLNVGDVCTYQRCGDDPALQQQCHNFLLLCSDESVNAEECVGAMIFFCRYED